jgi:aryl-alcohol dehydrogenase-like predicted oxidoreductase
MGMSQFYGPADDAQSVVTIRTALDLGVDFLDTSDIYGAADVNLGAEIRGFGHNERLIGEAAQQGQDQPARKQPDSGPKRQ